jgi:hypothetical protein
MLEIASIICRYTMLTLVMKLFLLTICYTYHTVVSVSDVSGDEVCHLFLAPSLTPGCGRGVFAGAPIHVGEIVENTVTIAVDHVSISGMQLNNYVWSTDESHISMAEFGAGMLYNHRNPPLFTHHWPKNMKLAADQRHAHTTFPSVLNVADRDISQGEEIFVSYGSGNDWLEQRGIVVADVPESSDPPPVRTLAELEAVGHCLTHVKVDICLLMFLAVRRITQSQSSIGEEVLDTVCWQGLIRDEELQSGRDCHDISNNGLA